MSGSAPAAGTPLRRKGITHRLLQTYIHICMFIDNTFLSQLLGDLESHEESVVEAHEYVAHLKSRNRIYVYMYVCMYACVYVWYLYAMVYV